MRGINQSVLVNLIVVATSTESSPKESAAPKTEAVS